MPGLWLSNIQVTMDWWSHTSFPQNVNKNLVMTQLSLWRCNNLVSMDWQSHTHFRKNSMKIWITRASPEGSRCIKYLWFLSDLSHTLFPWLPDFMFKSALWLSNAPVSRIMTADCLWWHHNPSSQPVTYNNTIRWQQSDKIILVLFSVSVRWHCSVHVSTWRAWWAHHMMSSFLVTLYWITGMFPHCTYFTAILTGISITHTENKINMLDMWKQKRNITSRSQLWQKIHTLNISNIS